MLRLSLRQLRRTERFAVNLDRPLESAAGNGRGVDLERAERPDCHLAEGGQPDVAAALEVGELFLDLVVEAGGLPYLLHDRFRVHRKRFPGALPCRYTAEEQAGEDE